MINLKIIMLACCIFLFIPLPEVNANFFNDIENYLYDSIEIVDFEPSIPNDMMYGFGTEGRYSGKITFRNNGFFPAKAKYSMDFYGENNTLIEQGLLKHTWILPERWEPYNFMSRFWKTYADEPVEKSLNISTYYNQWQDVNFIRIPLYRKIPFFGWIISDIFEYFTTVGKQRLDKNKIRIIGMNSPENLKQNDTEFTVNIAVINDGKIFQEAWVRVDKIHGSSFLENSDLLNINKLLFAEKELGRSMIKTLDGYGDKHTFPVKCDLRKADSYDKNIHIETNLFVKIGGRQYKVDTSLAQTIYHEQPICREESCIWLFIGTIFSVLIAALIITLIVRFIFPIFHKKSNK